MLFLPLLLSYHLCLSYSHGLTPIHQSRSLPYFKPANGSLSITFTLALAPSLTSYRAILTCANNNKHAVDLGPIFP